MAISVSSSIRYTGWILVGSCVAAIAIGKMCGPSPMLRSYRSDPQFVGFPRTRPPRSNTKLSFVRPENGQCRPLHVADRRCARIHLPGSCSPLARRARHEGRWSATGPNWSGEGGSQNIANDFGLARFSFPDERKPLNRVTFEISPRGTPCWDPGTAA